MAEKFHAKALEILQFYDVHDDFQLGTVLEDNAQQFLRIFTGYLTSTVGSVNKLNIMCLLLLISTFSDMNPECISDEIISQLIELLPLCQFNGNALSGLVDILRTGSNSLHTASEMTSACSIPVKFHSKILSELHRSVLTDNPPHISFPGDKESFVQLSGIPVNCLKGYTVNIWLKLATVGPSGVAGGKGFILYRCRSPTAGIDAVVSTCPTQQQGESAAYTLTLRANTEKKGKGEVQCRVGLRPGQWHLVTVQQHIVPSSGAERVAVTLDGDLCSEGELPYPFASTTPSESLWVFGLGFRGLLSGAALYPDSLAPELLALLFSAGPHIADMTLGVSCPQSSFDTGHMVLGTQIAKGRLAAKAYRCSPVFCVKASTLIPDAGLPLCSTGRLHEEHIEMSPPQSESDTPLIAAMAGGCAVRLRGSWVETVAESGGSSLLLYLFWTYSSALCSKTVTAASLPDSSAPHVLSSLKAVLRLLASLLLVSADLKEQLVQLHGFHVIGHCLAALPSEARRQYVDEEFADLCLGLARSLGPDATKGDGISAAMQGLLFDFRVWGACSVSTLRHYLERLTTLLLEAGGELYSSVGLQRILDVFRLHVARLMPLQSAAPDAASLSAQRSVVDCADSMHRLLIIAMDAARAQAMRNKANMSAEVELLLRCLEETSSCLIAERLLRLLGNMRISSPNSLLQALFAVRFHDTVVIGLLNKKGLSSEVRSGALVTLLWQFGEELRVPLQQVMQTRKTLNGILSAAAAAGPQQIKTHRGRDGHAQLMSAAEVAQVNSLFSQLRDSVKPLEKAWVILGMVAEVLSRAMADGAWGKLPPTCLRAPGAAASVDSLLDSAPSASSAAATEMDPFVSVLTHSGHTEAWLMLPLLPAILSRASAASCQQVLMSLNVMLKQDAGQCEALCSLNDRSWIQLIVSLALVGEVRANRYVRPAGHVETGEEMAGATTAELALDCLSMAVEHKTRLHVSEAWSTWNCLQNCIKAGCSAQFGEGSAMADAAELHLLKRSVSLVFQRLAKSCSEAWDSRLITVVVNILTFVDNRKLAGGRAVPSVDLLDLSFDGGPVAPAPRSHSGDDHQILSFAMDMAASMRKAAHEGALGGSEWPAVKLVHKITLSCLSRASEPIADRIAVDILAHLQYMSEPWVRVAETFYKNTVAGILTELRSVIKNPLAPEYLRGRYSALIFAILHFFIDIRHKLAEGRRVPRHVSATLDALVGIDNCADLDLVFKLLDVTMFRAGAISFDDDDSDANSAQSGQAQSAAQPLAPLATDASASLPVEDLLGTGASPPAAGPTLLDIFDLDAMAAQDEAARQQEGDRRDSSDSVEGRLGFHLVDGVLATEEPIDLASTGVASPSVSDEPLTAEQLEKQAREQRFQAWLRVRQGISAEWVDSERARLSRSMDTLDLSSEATRKFWKKARRKVEAEVLAEAHKCQWKLGVAHEGHFPGRRRVVLRPRFDNEYGSAGTSSWGQSSQKLERLQDNEDILAGNALGGSGALTTSEELDRALAKACAGYITDVTRDEDGGEEQDSRSSDTASTTGASSGAAAGAKVPGTGWGLVDADGSEEGYGVVGLTLSESLTPLSPTEETAPQTKTAAVTSPAAPSTAVVPGAQDLLGDVKQMEENFRQGKANATGPCHSGTRRVDSGPSMLDANVILITASGNFWGQLSFNGKEIFFTSAGGGGESSEDSAAVTLSKVLRMRRRRWVLSSVSAVYLRRFRLRDSAMEVFFSRGKHRNFFVDFGHRREDAKLRNEFARALMTTAPSTAFKQLPTMSHFRLVYDHGVQEKWLSGRMSNFDYLMALNTIAGRSYNDLCQYPVMPWVLCDYESPTIDLSDPAVYRDLSKPMGALNAARLAEFMDRFNSFEENVTSGIPPFMYGSHYSTMVGVVLHFLVRLQPFAALHKEMQNGHFDVPDRLFSSIPRSFRHNTNQLSEVKELTPEWFTTPEMFRNVNRFDFGQTQDDESVDDVELPPWAATPEEFVRINREALESDYVSTHLHEWIDLIFGHKQRGPDAVAAHNVFYYLTYYGSVDHYMIEDEALRRATELQIAHFGQIPMQLFKIPHPAKKPLASRTGTGSNITRPLKKCFAEGSVESFAWPSCDEECIAAEAAATLVNRNTNSAPLAISVLNDRLLCVSENGVVDVLRYSTSEEAKSALMVMAAAPKPGAAKKKTGTALAAVAPPDAQSSAQHAASATAGNGEVITFDDPFDIFGPVSKPAPAAVPSVPPVAIPSSDKVRDGCDTETRRSGDASSQASRAQRIMDRGEALVFVEKETSHFDVVPRIPLARPLRTGSRPPHRGGAGADPAFDALQPMQPGASHSESRMEQAAGLVCFTKAGNIAISAGLVDGRVAVRELDSRTGFVKSAGDFRAHKRRVVSVSSDAIPFASTDVVATLDEAGQLMVWTISRVRVGGSAVGYNYVVSRRPQRLFRCDSDADLHCEISWQMGVVVAVSGARVHIYSIERDEQLTFFQLHAGQDSDAASTPPAGPCSEDAEFSYTGPTSHGECESAGAIFRDRFAPRFTVRRLVVSDCGSVVVHVESCGFVQAADGECAAELQRQHLLLSYSLSGQRTARVAADSPVTYLSCPDRGDTVISGHRDGSVRFYKPQNLSVFHEFSPHLHCTRLVLGVAQARPGDGSRRGSSASKGGADGGKLAAPESSSGASKPCVAEASPVTCVRVGPNTAFPAVVVVSTESGNIYFRALPDFVRWEKGRSPSALAQLASAPIQAVRGTIQQAQNWTAETAGVLAQNARSIADDALGELKKIKRNSVVKGVANFFGLGGGKNGKAADDSDDDRK